MVRRIGAKREHSSSPASRAALLQKMWEIFRADQDDVRVHFQN